MKSYINTCDVCQRVKVKRHRLYNELSALLQSSRSWKKITMDFITNLSLSRRRDCVYDAILIIVDRYIKIMRYLSITKKINVFDLEQLLIKEIFLRFDSSEDIVTNRDSVFTSAFWSQVCYQMKMKRRLSTVFYSQTNNQIERQNQILKHYLRVFYNEQQND